MNKKVYILALLCFSFVFLLGRTISLEDAIQTARENNLSLQRVRYEMEASRWSYLNSRTQFLPKINLSETMVLLDEEVVLMPAIPLGIITGFLGAPLFAFLLIRQRKVD